VGPTARSVMKFETVAVELGPPLARPPVTARVATLEDRTAPSFAPLDGRVERVAVHIGDHVKEGDRLVLVRSGDLAGLQRDLEAARLAIATKRALLDRLNLLTESRAVSQNELLVAQSELNEARLSAAAAEARLRSLTVRREGDTGYWVLATRSGTVVQLDATPGKQVGPDKDRPVATVADLGEVLVLADVPQRDASTLRPGLPVSIEVPGAGAPVPGAIEVVSDVMDAERQTVPVRVRAPNRELKLRPHAFVNAVFGPAAEGAVMQLPSEAVVSDGATSVVFVETAPGAFRRRPVTLGRQSKDRVEITGGLEPAERVVVRGALLLLNAIDSHG
jgi:membrane fusion protein, heavy metal efflux system